MLGAISAVRGGLRRRGCVSACARKCRTRCSCLSPASSPPWQSSCRRAPHSSRARCCPVSGQRRRPRVRLPRPARSHGLMNAGSAAASPPLHSRISGKPVRLHGQSGGAPALPEPRQACISSCSHAPKSARPRYPPDNVCLRQLLPYCSESRRTSHSGGCTGVRSSSPCPWQFERGSAFFSTASAALRMTALAKDTVRSFAWQ